MRWTRLALLSTAGASAYGYCTSGDWVFAWRSVPERPQYTVLSVPSMEALAKEMVAKSPVLNLGAISWGRFLDGTPDVRIPTRDVQGKDVVLLVEYDVKEKGAGWLSTLGAIYALPRYGVKSLTVVMPYFPVGTMERVTIEGEVATAMTFARMLSATPQSTSGPVKFVFYDIHALQERFYFSDKVLPVLATAIPLVKREIEAMERRGEKVAIAFPDDGAKKRFAPMFQEEGKERWPVIVCTKERVGKERRLKLTEGASDVKGSHIVIVDDLVQTGGTMINCKNLLLSEGAKDVSGYVSHGVFPNDSWQRFTEDKGWKNFWITNSITSTAAAVEKRTPFKVLSLADCINEYLGVSSA